MRRSRLPRRPQLLGSRLGDLLSGANEPSQILGGRCRHVPDRRVDGLAHLAYTLELVIADLHELGRRFSDSTAQRLGRCFELAGGAGSRRRDFLRRLDRLRRGRFSLRVLRRVEPLTDRRERRLDVIECPRRLRSEIANTLGHLRSDLLDRSLLGAQSRRGLGIEPLLRGGGTRLRDRAFRGGGTFESLGRTRQLTDLDRLLLSPCIIERRVDLGRRSLERLVRRAQSLIERRRLGGDGGLERLRCRPHSVGRLLQPRADGTRKVLALRDHGDALRDLTLELTRLRPIARDHGFPGIGLSIAGLRELLPRGLEIRDSLRQLRRAASGRILLARLEESGLDLRKRTEHLALLSDGRVGLHIEEATGRLVGCGPGLLEKRQCTRTRRQ